MQNCEYKSRCKFYDIEFCSTTDADTCHYHKTLAERARRLAELDKEQREAHENFDIGLVGRLG